MRIVPDTNVIVSGTLWRGAPYRLLKHVRSNGVTCITSEPMLAELRRTFDYGKFGDKFEELGIGAVETIESLMNHCQVVETAQLPEPIAPDPDDDWVIATALAANADLIVTGDKPFLSLGTVGSVRIVTVQEALAVLDAI